MLKYLLKKLQDPDPIFTQIHPLVLRKAANKHTNEQTNKQKVKHYFLGRGSKSNQINRLCCISFTAGVGLRLCPQLLPSVSGCVLHPAAAKEESLRRDWTKRC